MKRRFIVAAGRVHPGERIATVIAEAARQVTYDEFDLYHGKESNETRVGLTELGLAALEGGRGG